MAKHSSADPVVARLDAILIVLQDLLIIEGAKAGLNMGTVRTILRADNKRISQTWKRLKVIRKNAKAA